jgi:type I phosphodiesterase/nucleotide pyrophosphatase
MKPRMSLDDRVLSFQRLIDRFVRWMRLGTAPAPGHRRLLIVQIDGLPRSVLELALGQGLMPGLRRMIDHGPFRVAPMSAGMPTSTPAFQLALMYGVRPDVPGFHYHDKRRGRDVYFPRAGDAAWVETTQTRGREGILAGGSTYGCVFTGGALNYLFSFAMIKRPTGVGLVRGLSAFVVLAWVGAKGILLTVVEITRALLRLVANPIGAPRDWHWLGLKLAISVWMRQGFTLAASRDVYRGVPAIYVNYLDYDVVAHAYGPRHPRALRTLRRVDRSLRQLRRVMRRVPEHRYDLYVVSDHGQTRTVAYTSLSGGRPLERVLLDEFLTGALDVSVAAPEGRRIASGIKALRGQRGHGLFQRFLHYLEPDFLLRLGDGREARRGEGVRVISAGPNAFVYFVDSAEPLPIERIEERYPRLAEDISRSRGIGFVLARSADGPVCWWRGQRYRTDALADGPFTGRDDLPLVVQGLRDLMAMPSAGDLVIYGNGSPDGDVSFVPEVGAHAGPGVDELHTFIVHPAHVRVPAPLVHPIQLYDHFIRYRLDPREEAA